TATLLWCDGCDRAGLGPCALVLRAAKHDPCRGKRPDLRLGGLSGGAWLHRAERSHDHRLGDRDRGLWRHDLGRDSAIWAADFLGCASIRRGRGGSGGLSPDHAILATALALRRGPRDPRSHAIA